MGEVDTRLAGLSPERRQLLQRLLQSKPAAPASAPPSAAESALPDGPKQSCMQFFDTINTQLDQTVFGEFSYFLNFGYIADHHPERAAVALPEQFVNRNSAKLILEVIGECGIEGRRVLDVGCGRGGTAYILNQFFRPLSFVGLDLSGKAICFCRQKHRNAGFAFVQGDAERLPFRDEALDIVTNIESSQSYPDIRAFYREVYRVLTPAGYFLYTDVRPVRQMAEWCGLLETIGFRMESDRDITSNVLLSCDDVAKQRRQAYGLARDDELIGTFLGAPGSPVYQEMRSGNWSYRILKLRKGHKPGKTDITG
jgi:SAM-dependent methyltransferase